MPQNGDVEVDEPIMYVLNSNKGKVLVGLNKRIDKKMATLMTCWPAGTDLKRLVVVGELE